jgi:hypothetical protein
VWGDISIEAGVLVITIPEHWLGEARYPVTVDPVIGSSAVGAYYYMYYIYDSEYEENLEGWHDEGASAAEIAEYLEDWTIMPSAYNELLFNRWTNPEPLQGLYKVYFHVAEIRYGSYNVFAPVLFNEAGNIPDTRISSEEYGYLGTRGSSPLGWNMVTFKIQNTLAANSPLWLGMISSGIGINFDYGAAYFDIAGSFNTVSAKTNILNGQPVGSLLNNCGSYIPQYLEALEYGDDEWIEELRPSIYYQNHNAHPKRAGRYDFKFSYYFQPASTAYSRTLTAGVGLTDTRKLAGVYKRTATQTVTPADTRKLIRAYERTAEQTAGSTDTRKLTGAYKRTATQTVAGITALGRMETFYRKCLMNVSNSMLLSRSPVFIRSAIEQITAAMGIAENRSLSRKCAENVTAETIAKRFQGFYRKAQEGVKGIDNYSFPVLFMRSLPETAAAADIAGHWGAYIRGLRVEAASRAETRHSGEYYRKKTETVGAEGAALRHLGIFIRLVTVGLVRDFLIGRFLKAREEIVLKSPVCREITIESRIH